MSKCMKTSNNWMRGGVAFNSFSKCVVFTSLLTSMKASILNTLLLDRTRSLQAEEHFQSDVFQMKWGEV